MRDAGLSTLVIRSLKVSPRPHAPPFELRPSLLNKHLQACVPTKVHRKFLDRSPDSTTPQVNCNSDVVESPLEAVTLLRRALSRDTTRHGGMAHGTCLKINRQYRKIEDDPAPTAPLHTSQHPCAPIGVAQTDSPSLQHGHAPEQNHPPSRLKSQRPRLPIPRRAARRKSRASHTRGRAAARRSAWCRRPRRSPWARLSSRGRGRAALPRASAHRP